MDIVPAYVMQAGEMDERELVLVECAHDLDKFNRTFLPKTFTKPKTPLFHRIMYRDLMDQSIKRLGFVAPRGHAKSTICSIGFPLHETVYCEQGRDKLIMLISEVQEQAANFIGIIKWNLENNRLIRYYFGNMVGRKWTTEDLITANNVRIIPRGTNQRVRGTVTGTDSVQRPDLICLDDFESETNSLTPDAVRKNKTWIMGAVEPSLAEDGRMVAVGTIIGMDAFLVDIQNDPTWRVHFFQAMMSKDLMAKGPHPIWPERFTRESLLALKASCEARDEGGVWWREYMNVPINMDLQDFREDWIQYHDHQFSLLDGIQPILTTDDGKTIPVDVTIGVDPAISMDNAADWTVIFALGQSAKGDRYGIDIRRMRTNDPEDIVQAFLGMAREYNASTISIETVQFQQVLATRAYQVMDENGDAFGIDEQKPRTSKDARIRSLQPLFKQRKVYLRSWMNEVVQELITFPRGRHDDTLDALWMANNISTPCDTDEIASARELAAVGLRLREPGGRDWNWLTN